MIAEILLKIVKNTVAKSMLSNIRLATACLLRVDKLMSLHPCDIDIAKDKMIIQITHSKIDQIHNGDEVPIACTRN